MGTIGTKIVFGKYWKDKANPGQYTYSGNPHMINYKMAPKIKSGLDLMVKAIDKDAK